MEKAAFSSAELREMFAETNRQLAEARAETDRRMAASRAEDDRRRAEEDDRRRAQFDRDLAASAAEFDRKLAESRADFDRRRAEEAAASAAARAASAAEFDRKRAEDAADFAAKAAEFDRRHAELEAAIKHTHDNINGISDSNGMLAQEYFYNALEKKLTFAGVHFDYAEYARGGKRKGRGRPTIEDEFDILLINKEAVAILEVKHRARAKDVDRLVDVKLKNFRGLYPEVYGKHKVYLGVAAMTFENDVAGRAKDRGVGLLKQVGETAEEEGAWEILAH